MSFYHDGTASREEERLNDAAFDMCNTAGLYGLYEADVMMGTPTRRAAEGIPDTIGTWDECREAFIGNDCGYEYYYSNRHGGWRRWTPYTIYPLTFDTCYAILESNLYEEYAIAESRAIDAAIDLAKERAY